MSHVIVANNIGRKFVDSLIHFWQDALPLTSSSAHEAYNALWALHDALLDWCLEDGEPSIGMYAIWPQGPVTVNPWILVNRPTRLLQKAANYLMETYPEDRGLAIEIGRAAYRFRAAMKKLIAIINLEDVARWNNYYPSVTRIPDPTQVPPIDTFPSLPIAVQAPTDFFLKALDTIRACPAPTSFRAYDTLQRAIWSIKDWPYTVAQRRLYEEMLDHDWYAEFYGTRYVELLEPIVAMICRQPTDRQKDLFTKLFETVIETMDKPHWAKMLALPFAIEELL
uniref:Uncharacterized protein n=1 Tax=viral metagenome TaxID=1070528 RepID=A0A6C0AQ07_9ZZZZ